MREARYDWRMATAVACVPSVLPLAVAGVAPAPAAAWGFEAHKYIMARAIPLLPAEIRPFFDAIPDCRSSSTPSIRTCGAPPAGSRSRRGISSTWTRTARYPFTHCRATTTRPCKRYGAGLRRTRTARCRGGPRRSTRSSSRRSRQKAPYSRDNIKFFSSVHRALRRRRARAVPCGAQLRRAADRPVGHPLAVRDGALRALPRALRVVAEARSCRSPTRASSSSSR